MPLSVLDLTPARRDRLRACFVDDKIDALVVTSFTNVTYLTGFTGDDSALLLTRDRAIVISDGRYTTQLEHECPDLEIHIRPVGQPLMPGIAEISAKLGVTRLGFEASSLTVAEHLKLAEALKTIELGPTYDRVEALRLIKDEFEVDAIRAAARSAERGFAMLRAGLRLDDSESAVADMLESYMRRCGAVSASFPPIIAVGVRAALPHARPMPDVKVGDDDFMLVDWGASTRPFPYKSDLTLVLVTGNVTPKFEKIYRVVLAAQLRGIAAIRPGVTGREVDAEARSVVEEAGFGDFFQHGLGHGLGLDIHEAPRLRKESEAVLRPGMVVTVEPGIYFPDWGGIRIEDDILVTTNGHEVLTNVPKELETVRV